MLHKKKTIIAVSFVLQVLIVKILSYNPEFVEQYYSLGIYPFISKTLRYTFGWLPFSFGDILYTVVAIYGIRWIYINIRRLKKDKLGFTIDVLAALAIIYGTFHLFWGLNYYRMPLYKSLSIKKNYSQEQLVSITKALIKKSNAIHFKITSNDSSKINLPLNKNTIFKMTEGGYSHLKKDFPHLEYRPKSIKKSLFSYPLTYMGFSGYLNPITNEAQVDGLIPVYKFPTTAAHEMAHQLGYAAENEANFIGFLASINNDNPYIKYSGYTFGLRFCLNEIYKRDKTLYHALMQTVNPGILKNYQEVRNFWSAYKNPAEPLFKIFYDQFLKANNQDKGMKSYSYVVALIVNYVDMHPNLIR